MLGNTNQKQIPNLKERQQNPNLKQGQQNSNLKKQLERACTTNLNPSELENQSNITKANVTKAIRCKNGKSGGIDNIQEEAIKALDDYSICFRQEKSCIDQIAKQRIAIKQTIECLKSEVFLKAFDSH